MSGAESNLDSVPIDGWGGFFDQKLRIRIRSKPTWQRGHHRSDTPDNIFFSPSLYVTTRRPVIAEALQKRFGFSIPAPKSTEGTYAKHNQLVCSLEDTKRGYDFVQEICHGTIFLTEALGVMEEFLEYRLQRQQDLRTVGEYGDPERIERELESAEGLTKALSTAALLTDIHPSLAYLGMAIEGSGFMRLVPGVSDHRKYYYPHVGLRSDYETLIAWLKAACPPTRRSVIKDPHLWAVEGELAYQMLESLKDEFFFHQPVADHLIKYYELEQGFRAAHLRHVTGGQGRISKEKPEIMKFRDRQRARELGLIQQARLVLGDVVRSDNTNPVLTNC